MRMITRTTLLLVSLAFLTCAPAPATPAATPAGVTNAFYHWYFSVVTTRGGWQAHLAGAKPYLAPSLYASLAQVIALEQRTHDAILDYDPFNDSQIFATSVTVGSAAMTGATAVVPVTIHYPRSSTGGHLKVLLRKSAAGWLIEDFNAQVGGSLSKVLAHALKQAH
jgi:hypothetical protein